MLDGYDTLTCNADTQNAAVHVYASNSRLVITNVNAVSQGFGIPIPTQVSK